jgi:hypothetical protein
MRKLISVSGGKTSAFVAANYKSDDIVFALVRTEDKDSRFKDDFLRKQVEDRIGAEFMATAEDDMIIGTVLDLEQFIGKRISWVTGQTFDLVVRNRGGWLPNKLHRYCTSNLKIKPIFDWWLNKYGIADPVEMAMGFRANEVSRANNMLLKTDRNGYLNFEASLENHKSGRHKGQKKWIQVPWQVPVFPLIEDQVFKHDIERFWEGKPVGFARYNNCVGCFHRNPIFLKYQFDLHPSKMEWFREQETEGKGTWRSDMSYTDIKKMMPQLRLYPEDFTECDSGGCEL